MAENIAASVLAGHRGVLGVCVAVKKPHVAIPGIFRSMGELLLKVSILSASMHKLFSKDAFLFLKIMSLAL